MALQITIIGLGQIGASVGLALKRDDNQLHRVGHDREPEVMRKAQKLGAVDQTVFNLHQSVERADVVVLALPVDEVRKTLELIGPDLREDAVVVDTSPLKTAPTAWAQQLLPPNRYFVSLTPSIHAEYLYDMETGVDAAHADLFKNSIFMVTCSPGTTDEVVKLASDLASLLGGRPMFSDTVESDGMFAAVDLLPKLAAAALVNATALQGGWRDSQRLAGHAYAVTTEPVLRMDGRDHPGQTEMLDRENLVRVLDQYIRALLEIRDTLAEEDAQGLEELLKKARQARLDWWEQRQRVDPDTGIEQAKTPTSGDVLRRLFVGEIGKNRSTKK